jgi:hypothetical protein
MSGEFEGLSIDNIFEFNGVLIGLDWVEAYFTNTLG